MTVSINVRNGLLSLRFRDPSGRQRRISLGIRDTSGNRGLAAMRADLIAADLSSGTYDPTHKRCLPANRSFEFVEAG
ncbi:MAG: hypothetical protein HC921_04500 [Synechococcaceae cyanobacterium SM2_3_1]|nr:hypothetical protein [Synechococcaceae cyanobacterium SM2_3_1]